MSELVELVRRVIDSRIQELHFCLPAQIETYDQPKQRASVKPLIRKNYTDGKTESLPVIVNVPVIWPRSGGAELHFPVLKGDTVLLHFSERALESWLDSGGESDPGDPRILDLTDAVAVPGLSPFSKDSLADNNTDVILTYKGARIRLQGDKKIAFGTQGEELFQILDELLQTLIDGRTPTALGLQRMETAIPDFTQIQARIKKIKGKL